MINKAFLSELGEFFEGRFQLEEPLCNHTTFRMGGPAEVWLPVENVAELVKAISLARQYDIPVFILGSGANLLIGTSGIEGLVIQNRADEVNFPPGLVREGESVCMTVGSGLTLVSLVRRCAQRGLSGLEWAVGIPGTVGGAVVNNAGAYGGEIAHNLARAELLSPNGERIWQPVAWFDYSYRSSRLKKQSEKKSGGQSYKNWVVLQAEMRLKPAPVESIEARMLDFNERRKARQPGGATVGSMFKNPPGDYAGRLIEAAGLKGYRLGQAQISSIHANFFQNLGGATPAEMMTLIKMAQDAVKNKFGVELELEIELV